ncbi:hypothetical protein MOQ_009549 [Trypanosoma cruzi marinkellei]|uniref:Uncharacterized protein n=1 Tax=Trypanosoma cruzi marinkellei TaxID=85056 RepID=K2NCH8_TRYCR|nr:hypothetical protein MOQ_009549 [Trypanosoma cruzi marinkellei]
MESTQDTVFFEQSFPFLELQFPSTPLSQKKEQHNFVVDAPDKDQGNTLVENASEKFPRESGEAVCCAKEDVGKADNSGSNFNGTNPADPKCANLDHQVLESAVLPNNRTRSSTVFHSISDEINPSCVYDTAYPWLYQVTEGNKENFIYGLDALLHGVNAGFAPQPPFRVALPNSLGGATHKSQDVDYDFDLLENATVPAEVYFPRSAAPVSSLGGPRRKFGSGHGNSWKGKASLSNTPSGEMGVSSVKTPLLSTQFSRKEALAREARSYMQEAEFIINQLFGEGDNGGTLVDGSPISNTPRKVNAADLEALMTEYLVPRSVPPSTPISTVSGEPKFLPQAKETGGFKRSQQIDKEPQFSSEKKRNADMEYPSFDDVLFREPFFWPESSPQPLRTAPSSTRGQKSLPKSSIVSQEFRPSTLKTPPPRDKLRQELPLNEFLGSMEYPSAVDYQNDAGSAMTKLQPPFPQTNCSIAQGDQLVLANTPPRKLEGNEEGLRNEEQRIKDARRQASDNFALRASRMVVMDNRFAPKTTRVSDLPDSGQAERKEAQERENEERRARVKAYLEQRRAERKEHEEVRQRRSDEEKVERPSKLPKHSFSSSAGLEQTSTQGANPMHRTSQRRIGSAKGATHSAAAPHPKQLTADVSLTRESLKSPKLREEQNTKSENHIRSLVIIHRSKEVSNTPAKIRLVGATKLEIHQGIEPPLFFDVDECLESYDGGIFRSITLSRLCQMFLSGLNVSMCLAGSESVELLSWRPLREVMQGVFQDLGEGSQLFLSVALVQQGLTQDLLSESGRMVRTTFKQTALLDVTLENVGYVKLQDLRHFSKILARGWEVARVDHTRGCGFFLVSVILKQIKEDDVILSSMLVICGKQSVTHLNSLLKKENHESSNLISAALGVSCFTVAVLTLSEEDRSVTQLMNTQNKLASIVNSHGNVGSLKKFLEEAEKELAATESDDPSAQKIREALQEKVAVAKRALMDPQKFFPREAADEPKMPHEPISKANLETAAKVTDEAPHDAAGVEKNSASSQSTEKQQPQKDDSKSVREEPDVSKQVEQPLSMHFRKMLLLPPPDPRAADARESTVSTTQEGHLFEVPHPPETVSVVKALPNNAKKNKDSAVAPNMCHSTTSSQQEKKANTPVTLPIIPLAKLCMGQRQPNFPRPPGENGREVPAKRVSSFSSGLGRGVMKDIEKGPIDSQDPTHAGDYSSTQTHLLVNANSGARTEQQLKKNTGTTITLPQGVLRASSAEGSRPLSASTTVGTMVSTRYINREDVPLKKPVFHHIEAPFKGIPPVGDTTSTAKLPPINKKSSGRLICSSVELPKNADTARKNSLVTLISEQEEYVEEEEEGREKSEFVEDNSIGNERRLGKSNRIDDRAEMDASLSSNVRTLVVLDPRCKETVNVTHDGTVVIVMTDDDFEEYEVDEVIERPDGCEVVNSKMLDKLLDKFMLGCNVAILAADSRRSSLSSFALKGVVHDVLNEIREKTFSQGPKYKGILSVSIVQVRGETVVDLLKENSAPRKLVIAISPIFGPCIHNVTRLPVENAAVFDSMLTAALTRASVKEREYGMVFISFVLKQKLVAEKDVIVSSLVFNLVGENVGLYLTVLDRSPLVSRALFHYALGGPCFTLAVLGFSGDETRMHDMLAVQRRLGEMTNRPTHRGSINKFINGIRTDLAPALSEKLRDSDDRESTEKILRRLEEMAQDAEKLLENFEDNDPKAYLNDADEHPTEEDHYDRTSLSETVPRAEAQGRVHSLVCFEQRMPGNGCIAVENNSLLLHNGEFVCRYDVDEVVVRDSSGSVPSSQLIDDLVAKFLMGHNTALLAAESRSSAVTPLILRKIAYLIVYNISLESPSTTIKGDLLVSIALVKDDVTVDLLAVHEGLAFHRFEVEVSSLFSRRLRGASYHIVTSAEGFDHLLAVAVDRAEPALRSEDPGVMVVALSLTQYVESPARDVLVSSFIATTVFDSVSHYTGVLHKRPNEPTGLFKLALGGPCYTIAMLGLCDDEENAGDFLTVQMELAHVHNCLSRPVSVVKHVNELKKGIAKLFELQQTAEDVRQQEYISTRITQLRAYLHDAESLLELPVRERGFVPLGSDS